jgi:hypothetical protein
MRNGRVAGFMRAEWGRMVEQSVRQRRGGQRWMIWPHLSIDDYAADVQPTQRGTLHQIAPVSVL